MAFEIKVKESFIADLISSIQETDRVCKITALVDFVQKKVMEIAENYTSDDVQVKSVK